VTRFPACMPQHRMWVHVFCLVTLAALILLVVWAMMGRVPAGAGTSASASATLAVLLTFGVTFGALAVNVVGRLQAVAVGAFISLLLGALLQFYFPGAAAQYLLGKLDTLVLLAGMSVVSGLLAESGALGLLALKTVHVSRGNPLKVMTLLCTLTYCLSLFMNNLATILVMIPISLRVAKATDMEPTPLVLGEIIASNLGGASTMVGDFPNMLIATETGLPFHEFLVHLAPVCLLQLGVLILFLRREFPRRPLETPGTARLLDEVYGERMNHPMAARGLVILTVTIVGFLVARRLGIPVAAVAGAGAALAFLLGKASPRALLRRLCIGDVLFFACLFIMVGALNAAGFLDAAGGALAAIWLRSPLWAAIALAWGAALLTCFLSAGPSAALLIHALMCGGAAFAPGETVWWALSLGVCAGSSATLTGATAGPVTASLMEKDGYVLTFTQFARTGLPVMLMFLFISSCYLAAVVR